MGVIEPLLPNEPRNWCARMVVVAKKDVSPRHTVDFQGLNKAAKRQTHHTLSPSHEVSTVPSNTWKSVVDCWNSYHAVKVRDEDKHYLTFITPFGRFRYLHAPQGYLAAGDAYTHRMDLITSNMEDLTRLVDDALMWKTTI